MNIVKRIKEKRDQKHKAEILSEHYRKKVFNDEALKHLSPKDFDNLISVAKYADFGRWTAVEAAFCLGYIAGKGGAV